MHRRFLMVFAGVAVAMLAVGVDPVGVAQAATTTAATEPASPPPAYPTAPPAKVCGNTALLSGPAVQPAGSVRVDPGSDLDALTVANPPGTTFWLAPGTHLLGTDPFDQVIPKAGNTYVGAPGAILDGQRKNLYAFTQTAPDVTIRYLTIQNFFPFQDQAAVNHNSGSGWTIEYNTIKGTRMAAMNAGPNSVTRYNCITGNGQTGINGLTGTANVLIDHNEIGFNSVGPDAPGEACGCQGGVKLFGVQDVRITNNWIHDNAAQGVWGDTNAVGWLIEGNFIEKNANEAIFFETSYNAFIHNNTISRNALVKGRIFADRNDNFPIAAVYISEGGGDSRLYGGTYATLDISGNNFDNNWGGVTLWEDANRFCNTPGNTAPGFCPIAGVATPATCVAGTIEDQPYYDDCRWRTMNVQVHDNIFTIDKVALDCEGTRCGENSIFSNIAESPSWSPYLGDKIQQAITFEQNNRFFDNTYAGDWNFDVFAQGLRVSWATWRAAPYFQDAGSTLTQSNALDSDTSTLEGSLGAWSPWFSSTVARSITQAHAGTGSLQVGVGGQFWGVTLNNYPFFAATPGPKTFSFWGKTTSAGSQGVTMEVTWRGADGSVIRTDRVSIPELTATWQQASASVSAPDGTVTVGVDLRGSNGIAGSSIFLDDFVIADGGTPPPPAPAGDLIDDDTATVENSTGHWVPWFSATVAKSTAQAHTGSGSLQVGVAGQFWGVTLDNYPYFKADPGPKTLSFWGMTTGGSQGVTMEVTWRNAAGSVIKTDIVAIPALTSTWQQGTAVVTAPEGTVTFGVDLRSSTGIPGTSVFLDDFVVMDGGTPPPPPPPPPPGDAIDADTATLETSTGHWVRWFSSTVARSTAEAHTGTGSLEIGVASQFWGVTTNNFPYFATSPGTKTISFWGKTTSAGSQGVTMEVTWRDASGATIKTDSIAIASLTTTWQEAAATVTAPDGTVTAGVDLRSSNGIPGTTIFLDDFYVSV